MSSRRSSNGNRSSGMAVLALCIVAGLSLLTGCATPGVTGSGDPPSGEPTADEPVLQVEQRGGFVPLWAKFERVPQLTVYADGQAISQGPQIAIYPAPALPNLLVQNLSDAALTVLLDLARDAGLMSEPPDYGEPLVADATTTVVTLHVDGASATHEAYALGVAPPPGMSELPEPFLDPAAEQARETLSRFIEEATQLVANAGAESSYQPEAFAVMAAPVPDDEPPADPAETGVEPTVMPWPIDASLNEATDCLLIEGNQAEQLRIALTDANTLTRFEQGGQIYDIAVRPLLPGEHGCPEIR